MRQRVLIEELGGATIEAVSRIDDDNVVLLLQGGGYAHFHSRAGWDGDTEIEDGELDDRDIRSADWQVSGIFSAEEIDAAKEESIREVMACRNLAEAREREQYEKLRAKFEGK
jgi:hypothetical protein